MNQLRILDLDWDLRPDAFGSEILLENGTFTEAKSFYEYDAVFVDPLKVDQLWSDYLELGPRGSFSVAPQAREGLGLAVRNLFQAREEECRILLEGGGYLFCRLRRSGPPLLVQEKRSRRSLYFDRYSWISGPDSVPLSWWFKFKRRRGRRINLAPSRLRPYLEGVKKDLHYRVVLEGNLREKLEDQGVSLVPLAETLAGELIALEVNVENGSIFLLPPPEEDKGGGKEESDLLAKNLQSILQRASEPPDWIQGLSLPGEETLERKLGELEERRERLSRKKAAMQERKKLYQELKRPLYAKNKSDLIRSVKPIFEQAGFELAERGNLHLLASLEGLRAGIVCCPLSENEEIREAYWKLNRGMEELRAEEGKGGEGLLLFGPSDLRPQPPKNPPALFSLLPEGLLEGCHDHDLTVKSTYQLFTATRTALSEEGNLSGRQLYQALFSN